LFPLLLKSNIDLEYLAWYLVVSPISWPVNQLENAIDH
jgi:hypothetical protein